MEVRFNLKSKKETKSLILLKFRYIKNALPFVFSTGIKIEPNLWNDKKMRAKAGRTHPHLSQLNEILNTLESETLNIYYQYINQRQFLTRETLKAHLNSVLRKDEPEQMTLLKYIPQFIEERKKNPRFKQRGTVSKYPTWLKHFKEFCDYKKKEYDFDDINWQFLNDFQEYLFMQKNQSINYAGKGIATISLFVKEARKAGYTDNITVNEKGFSIAPVKANKTVLYFDELELIEKIDWDFETYEGFSKERLQKVVDFIFVGCWTGIRRNMFQKLHPGLVKRFRGVEMIEVFTQKTDELVAIPLMPQLKQVLEKNNYQMPYITGQELNRVLKIVCKKAQINEKIQWRETTGGKLKITTREKWEVMAAHAFRRSFATNMTLLGLPASMLMPITGHSTERQFQNYINIGKRLNAENVAKNLNLLPGFLKILNKKV